MKKNFKEEYFNGSQATLKEKIEHKLNNAKDWAIDNKELLIKVAPVVIGGVRVAAKIAHKQIVLHKTKDLKELYCYDRSLGHYWQLKRKLSNKEWIEIDKRKANGERLSDILSAMNVLK